MVLKFKDFLSFVFHPSLPSFALNDGGALKHIATTLFPWAIFGIVCALRPEHGISLAFVFRFDFALKNCEPVHSIGQLRLIKTKAIPHIRSRQVSDC